MFAELVKAPTANFWENIPFKIIAKNYKCHEYASNFRIGYG